MNVLMSRVNRKRIPQHDLGPYVPLKLWTETDNKTFFAEYTKHTSLKKGEGFLTELEGFTTPVMELLVKGLEANDYPLLKCSYIEFRYPEGSWWEEFINLSHVGVKVPRHSIFEVNHKINRTMESLIKPLNYLYHTDKIHNMFLIDSQCQELQQLHPLTAAILVYSGANQKHIKSSHIDYFMQSMISQHGVPMRVFLQLLKEKIVLASTAQYIDHTLVDRMGSLQI